MDRKIYNECISRALKGQHFTPGERKREFCIAAKTCSGKAPSREAANQMCEVSASQPKPAKASKGRRAPAASGGGGMRLILLTTTGCKPCAAAKSYLQDRIDRGEIEVMDVQKSDFAAELAAKHGLQSVPKLMIIDSQGVPFSEIQVTENEQMI